MISTWKYFFGQFVIFCVLTTAFAQTSRFTYTLPGLGVRNDISACNLSLTAIIAKLQAQRPMANILSYGCFAAQSNQQQLDGIIDYEAAEKLDFSKAFNFASIAHRSGVYPDRAGCDADLNHQVEVFVAATHLQPLFSYCLALNGEFWSANIDALGSTSQRRRVSELEIFDRSDIGRFRTLKAMVAAKLNELGRMVSESFLYQNYSGKKLRFVFYSAELESVIDHNIVRYDNAVECQRELTSIDAKFAVEVPRYLGAICQNDNGLSGNRLVILSLSLDLMRPDGYITRNIGEKFDSREVCVSQSDAIFQDLVDRGFQPIVILCSEETRGEVVPVAFLRQTVSKSL